MGPTGFGWWRSLLSFRHRNPLGRTLSMITAVAIAALLVVGSGPAYADDTTPAPAAETTSTDTGGDATSSDAPASADETAAPAEEQSDGAAAADDSSAADAASTTAAAAAPQTDAPASSPTISSALAKIASTPTSNLVVPCGDSDANALIGGFEIDGDTCVNHGGEDWDGVDTTSPRYAETLDRFVDDGDTSGYQGSSKALTDPLTWAKGPSPNDKSDIEKVRVYSQKFGDPEHTYSDFAIDRHPDDGGQGGTGTVTYDVEYNQLPDVWNNDHTLSVPNRSEGDLWFVFDQHGNISLDYIAGYKYYDTDQGGCKAVENGGFWCLLPAAPTFGGDTSDDGSFAEGTLDISDAFDQGVCFTFGVVNVRTRTSNTDTTAFKDYIAPLEAITSNCGSLVITKRDANTEELVGGGVYQIVGDPRPDGAGAGIDGYQLCIYDGPDSDLGDLSIPAGACDELIADGNADGQITIDPVLAGSYTVTEIVPPPGYLLNPEPDPGNSQDVEVVDGEPSAAPFANVKAWEPLDLSKTADGTFTATYTWTVNKQIARSANGPWVDDTTQGAPLVKTVGAGDDTSLYYRVTVTEGATQTSHYVVSGSIHVANPNADDVNASIEETLDPGCTIDADGDQTYDGNPVDVVVSGTTGSDFAYTCDLGNGPVDPGTNTATVTWDMETYPQADPDLFPDTNPDHYTDSGSDGFTFAETASIDKTITVTDDHFAFDPAPWTITYGDEADGVYESKVYSIGTSPAAGTCSAVITNTATITGDDDVVRGQDAESGQVCVPALVIPPEPPVVKPPHHVPAALPNTGGPDARLLAVAFALLLGGGALVLGDRRRRRRS